MDSIVYFASDFHLGIRNSRHREDKIIRWLHTIGEDATHIFLLGDLFDYWFEYKNYIPKGYSRFFGKLAELTDAGVTIEVFTGNHDIWMFDYFQEELNIPVHRDHRTYTFNGKNLWIGHGDGKGPGDHGYKRLKKVFHHPLSQFLYRQIHPDLAHRIARYFSKKSRDQENHPISFLGAEKEWLIQYCERKLTEQPDIDYFIFGHRHLPIYFPLSNQRSVYINTGDWLFHNTYACMRSKNCYLYDYEQGKQLFPGD